MDLGSLLLGVAAVLTALGAGIKYGGDGFARWRRRRRMERAQEQRWQAYLLQLDEEARGVMFGFLAPDAGVQVLNPCDPTVRMLMRDGVLEDVGSAGGYDAVARRFRLRPAVHRRLLGL